MASSATDQELPDLSWIDESDDYILKGSQYLISKEVKHGLKTYRKRFIPLLRMLEESRKYFPSIDLQVSALVLKNLNAMCHHRGLIQSVDKNYGYNRWIFIRFRQILEGTCQIFLALRLGDSTGGPKQLYDQISVLSSNRILSSPSATTFHFIRQKTNESAHFTPTTIGQEIAPEKEDAESLVKGILHVLNLLLIELIRSFGVNFPDLPRRQIEASRWSSLTSDYFLPFFPVLIDKHKKGGIGVQGLSWLKYRAFARSFEENFPRSR